VSGNGFRFPRLASVRVPNGVSNMPQAYSYYSHYEALTLAFIRERIGRGLRERYPAPKELPPKLWALVVQLDVAESNYLLRYSGTTPDQAPRAEPRSANDQGEGHIGAPPCFGEQLGR
jgi:hypothetical protein